MPSKGWRSQSWATCGSCGVYRYHAKFGTATTCVCGQPWPKSEIDKAKWYAESAGKVKMEGDKIEQVVHYHAWSAEASPSPSVQSLLAEQAASAVRSMQANFDQTMKDAEARMAEGQF